MDAVATILAGGVDVYLWPQSRKQMPKFCLPLHPDGSMLQGTLSRLQPLFTSERIAIATTVALSTLLQEHLPNFPPSQLILEPIARNTAPCLALSALWWEQRCSPQTVMFLFPADHAIANVGEFYQSLEHAAWVAAHTQRPVVLGLPPQWPETRFGYIQVESWQANLPGVCRVRTFAEKPDFETAQRFLELGDFLWYTGILALPLATVWELLHRHLLDYYSLFAPLRHRSLSAEELLTAVEPLYRQLRPLSIEYGILEAAAPDMLALRCSFDWSDVGTWDEIYRRSLKDPRGNVLQGDVIAIDTSSCYVSAYGGKPIALVGISDLIVVETEHATLICPRGAAARVAELVQYLRRKKRHNLL